MKIKNSRRSHGRATLATMHIFRIIFWVYTQIRIRKAETLERRVMGSWVIYAFVASGLGALHTITRAYAMKSGLTSAQVSMILNCTATIISSATFTTFPSSKNWFGTILSVLGGASIYLGSYVINEAYARGNSSSVTILSKTYPVIVYGFSIATGESKVTLKKLMGCACYAIACYCFLDWTR